MLRGAPAWPARLGVGVAAGRLCSRIGTPIPWMPGPLVALAAWRVSGVPMAAPPGGRQAGQGIIGTAPSRRRWREVGRAARAVAIARTAYGGRRLRGIIEEAASLRRPPPGKRTFLT
jgi:hypothetical protein